MLNKIIFFLVFLITIYSNAQNNGITHRKDYLPLNTSAYQDFTWNTGLNSKKINFMSLSNYNSQQLTYNLNTTLAFKKRKHPMEKVGRILTYVGIPLGIIGGIMTAKANDHYYECVNGNCTGDASGAFGAIFLGAGIGLSGTGTVLWIIGSKK